MTKVRIERLTGEALRQHLPDLARLRIDVFRDFPYLYDGSPDYEQRYLETYALTPQSIVVAAFDGPRLVGAATALPFAAEPNRLTQRVAEAGYPVDKVFYCGESVLDPAFRGQGIGVRFFEEREAHARSLGGFTQTAFCAVVRPEDHPRRPEGYRPLDQFWRNRGYRKIEGAQGSMSWRDLDEPRETTKAMQFWIKTL